MLLKVFEIPIARAAYLPFQKCRQNDGMSNNCLFGHPIEIPKCFTKANKIRAHTSWTQCDKKTYFPIYANGSIE